MKKRSVFERIAAIPPISWSVLFILAPLGFVLYFALTDRNGAFTWENITSCPLIPEPLSCRSAFR